MITVPVLLEFDEGQEIGTMQLDETKLPQRPNYVFAIGFHMATPHRLMCVSLVNDKKYLEYLDSDQNKQLQELIDP